MPNGPARVIRTVFVAVALFTCVCSGPPRASDVPPGEPSRVVVPEPEPVPEPRAAEEPLLEKATAEAPIAEEPVAEELVPLVQPADGDVPPGVLEPLPDVPGLALDSSQTWPLPRVAATIRGETGLTIRVERCEQADEAVVEWIGDERAAPGEAAAWLQDLLPPHGLVMAPAGPGEWRVVPIEAADAVAVRVAPRHLARLEQRDGLLVNVTFRVVAGIDVARIRKTLAIVLSPEGDQREPPRFVADAPQRTIEVTAFAPLAAAVWRLLAQMDMLAGEVARPGAAPPVPHVPEGDVLRLPDRPEGLTVRELLAWCARELDLTFHCPKEWRLRERVGFIGPVDVERRDALRWLRATLAHQDLAIVPLGGGRRWRLVSTQRGAPRSRPLALTAGEIGERPGRVVVTALRLRKGVAVREALGQIVQMGTRGCRVELIDERRTLIVADYDQVLGSTLRVLSSMGLLETPLPASVPAPDTISGAGDTVHLAQGKWDCRALLAWCAKELGLTFVHEFGNARFERDSEVVGTVEVERRHLLAWIRTRLWLSNLTMVPLDPAGSSFRHGRDWAVVDLADPDLRTLPVLIPPDGVEHHAGAYVRTVFRLREGADVQNARNALSNLSTRTAGLGNVLVLPAEHTIVVQDVAPVVAAMWRVLDVLGVLADGSPVPPVEEPLAAPQDDPVERLPATRGGIPMRAVFEWARDELGIRVHYATGNAPIRYTKLDFFGRTGATSRAEALAWFRSMLRLHRLVAVPIDPGTDDPDAARDWYVIELPNPHLTSFPSFLYPDRRGELERYAGIYVVTAFRLRDLPAPERGTPTSRLRSTLGNLSTRVAGIGRVMDDGVRTLVVGDFARVIGAMDRVLQRMDVLADARADPAEPPAPAETLEDGDEILRLERRQRGREHGYTIAELLEWASENLDVVIHYGANNATVKGTLFDFVGEPRFERRTALSWLRSALLYRRLSCVPIGTGGREWFVLEQAHPLVTSYFVDGEPDDLDLEVHGGSFVVTSFALRDGVDVARMRNVLSNLSTKTAGIGRVMNVPSGRYLVVGDYAEVVIEMRRLLGLLGVLADARTPTGADGPPEPERPDELLQLEARKNGYTPRELLEWVSEALDLALHYETRNATLGNTVVRFAGTVRVERRHALAWLRSVLLVHGLALTPMGAEPREFFVLERANPHLMSRPRTLVTPAPQDRTRHLGAYVVAVFRLRDGLDATPIRNALALFSTPVAGIGRVMDLPGAPALVVADFAHVVETARSVLAQMGALAEAEGGGEDDGGAPLANLQRIGRPRTSAIDPVRGPLRVVLDEVAGPTGQVIVYSGSGEQLPETLVTLGGPAATSTVGDAIDRVRAALVETEAVLVPVFAPTTRLAATWCVMDAKSTLMPENYPLAVPSRRLPELADRDGLYVVTALRLNDAVDVQAALDAILGFASKKNGSSRLVSIEPVGALVVRDFAPRVARMRERLGELGMLHEE